jgi:hypothetical protein
MPHFLGLPSHFGLDEDGFPVAATGAVLQRSKFVLRKGLAGEMVREYGYVITIYIYKNY